MTGICLKDEVAQLLRAKAKATSLGLNDYLTSILMASALGPSQQCNEDRPGTVPEPTTQQLVSLIQALIQQNSQNQSQNQKQPILGEAFCEQKGSVVGLPGFGPGSRAPEAHSLDQASRQPLNGSLVSSDFKQNLALILKTLPKIQHLSKANQRAISYRLMRIAKEELGFSDPSEVERFVYSMDVSSNYKNKLFQAHSLFFSWG